MSKGGHQGPGARPPGGLDQDDLLQGLRGLTLSLHAVLADLPGGALPARRLRAILGDFDGLLAQAEPEVPGPDLREGPRELALRLCRSAQARHAPGAPRLALRLRGEGRGQAASPRASRLLAELLQLWLQPQPGPARAGVLAVDLWWLEPVLFVSVRGAAERLGWATGDDWQPRLAALGAHLHLQPLRGGRALLTLALPAAQAYRRR